MTNQMFDLPEGEAQPPRRRRRSPAQEEEQFVNQMMYLLAAPHIGWPGWIEILEAQKANITLQRLMHAREIFDQEMCTEFEAMLYISTVSLAQPMSHDWTEIYMYLFRRWNPQTADSIAIGDPQLYQNQIDQLNQLRRWVYRNQMNHLKAKHGAARREEVQKERQQLEAEQPKMFE